MRTLPMFGDGSPGGIVSSSPPREEGVPGGLPGEIGSLYGVYGMVPADEPSHSMPTTDASKTSRGAEGGGGDGEGATSVRKPDFLGATEGSRPSSMNLAAAGIEAAGSPVRERTVPARATKRRVAVSIRRGLLVFVPLERNQGH
jgi:hypothetical protein